MTLSNKKSLWMTPSFILITEINYFGIKALLTTSAIYVIKFYHIILNDLGSATFSFRIGKSNFNPLSYILEIKVLAES